MVAPPKVLRRLNSGGHKVVDADRCVTRLTRDTNANRWIHFRDTNQRPAYLLDVEIIEAHDGWSSSVEVGLADGEPAPFSGKVSDVYTATKTEQGWTLDYEGKDID